jgi:dipeptidyl aminopeptidase/acylaminoacyl peptidase
VHHGFAWSGAILAVALITNAGHVVKANPITIEDLVKEAVLDPAPAPDGSIGIMSPDHRRAAEVIRRGEPTKLTNSASLLVFNLDGPQRGSPPHVVARFASAGKYLPIGSVKWLNATELTFLGTDNRDIPQVFEVRLDGRPPVPITHLSLPVIWYDVSADARVIAAAVQAKPMPISENPACKLAGCRVEAQSFDQAETGVFTTSKEIIVTDLQTRRTVKISPAESSDDNFRRCHTEFFGGISPDGRYGIQLCTIGIDSVPAWWADYQQLSWLGAALRGGETGLTRRWLVVDLRTGQRRAISDVPVITLAASFVWIGNGHRLFVPAGLEPLTDVSGAERTARATLYSALEIDPATGEIHRVRRLDASMRRVLSANWNQKAQAVEVVYADEAGINLTRVTFRPRGDDWLMTPTPADNGGSLKIAESLNDRPIFMVGGTKVYDPDPWLAGKDLAHVEPIEWTSRDGKVWHGGLYGPSGSSLRLIPLVIQTHGFNPQRFSLSGLNANFVAQVLAAKGVAVVQVDDDHIPATGLSEFDTATSCYEGLIDHLTSLGFIDRERVGIEGWSRSGAYVEYALTHSKYHLAAASTIEPGNFGWWSYVATGGAAGEGAYGKPPFGDGLQAWVDDAPTFHLEKVETPLLMWDSELPLWQWDWYAVLRRLKKPVEYWVFPQGAHEAYRVSDRLRSNGLLVDWFQFWLLGQEDTESRKADQYRRWERLCDLQIAQHVSAHTFCVISKR